ncbi:MAG: class I SAM-dependent methyltransferase [Synechococcales cyanobacterium]
MDNIYKTGEYLHQTGGTWHSEDSYWKAAQVLRILKENHIQPKTVGEIGCGAGRILIELSKHEYLRDCQFEGYDISPQAIDLCEKNVKNCNFFCSNDFIEKFDDVKQFDVLLVIDVFEHVPDYMGFVEKCCRLAEYKIYHIPLDIHVSSVLRNAFIHTRYSIGHLHYFTADSALATLKDTGHQLVSYFYTSAFGVFTQHPKVKTAVANCIRWFFSRFSLPLTSRIFGGYSLLVLTK